MILNYFQIGIRSIKKHKVSSIISLLGLSISLSSVLIIILHIKNEKLVDKGKIIDTNTYFFSITQNAAGNSRDVGLLTQDFDDWLKKQSFISATIPYRDLGEFHFRDKDNRIKAKVSLTDSNFFEFFDFKLLKGEKSNALREPNSIILSEQTADQLFPGQNPLGKTVTMLSQDKFIFKVTGVIEDSYYTSINYENLISWDSKSVGGSMFRDWYRYSLYLFGKSSQDNSETLSEILSSNYQEDFPESNYHFNAYPMSDFYFDTKDVEFMSGFNHGNKQNLQILGLVGVLLFIIGTVNYMNINISILLKRIREIGMRKVLGANRSHLYFQFLLESFILASLASVGAFTLAQVAVFIFPEVENARHFLFDRYSILILSALVITITGITGIYPYLFGRKIEITNALKSKVNNIYSTGRFSNLLLGIQFFITLSLIVGAYVVYSQYDFVR